jgi:hypothetical protein
LSLFGDESSPKSELTTEDTEKKQKELRERCATEKAKTLQTMRFPAMEDTEEKPTRGSFL